MSMDDDDEFLADVSATQSLIMDIASIVTGVLSVGGSSYLMYILWKDREAARSSSLRQPLNSHHRFLFGMSFFDIIGSMKHVFSRLLTTHEPSFTCTLEGVLANANTVAPLYNAALAFFYVSVIRYQMPESKFAERYEKIWHIVSMGIPCLVMVTFLSIQGFNPSEGSDACVAAPYPRGCVDDESIECERGEKAGVVFGIIFIPGFAFVFISLIVNNLLIFLYVRNLEKRCLRWAQAATESTFAPNSNVSLPALQEDRKNRAAEQQQAFRKTRMVATQSFLYVLAFLWSNIWIALYVLLRAVDPDGFRRGEYLWWNWGSDIAWPSQGFCNVFIYMRGRRQQEREAAERASRRRRRTKQEQSTQTSSLAQTSSSLSSRLSWLASPWKPRNSKHGNNPQTSGSLPLHSSKPEPLVEEPQEVEESSSHDAEAPMEESTEDLDIVPQASPRPPSPTSGPAAIQPGP